MTALMPNDLLDPAPDYDMPGAYWWPAHFNNYGTGRTGYKKINVPVALILHTPEENADDREVTPDWFQNPFAQASTHYYSDNDGDLIQMVRDEHCPFANGVDSTTAVVPRPNWRVPGVSYNTQTLSIEIEGRAASIHHTMKIGGAQWNRLVEWCRIKAAQYNIPIDRDHIMGHYQLANNRTDPGAKFPWDELMSAISRPAFMWTPKPKNWRELFWAMVKQDERYIRVVREDRTFRYSELRTRK